MPGVFNKFFKRLHKNLNVFRKNNGLLFFRFGNCGHLEGGHRANVSNQRWQRIRSGPGYPCFLGGSGADPDPFFVEEGDPSLIRI